MRNFEDRARFEAEMTLAERLPERSILDVFIAAAAIRPDRVAITQVEVRRLGADGSLGDVCGTGEIGVITVCGSHVSPGYRNPSTTRVSSRARSASAERTMRLAVSRGARVLAAEPRAIAEQPGRRADPALDHFGSARMSWTRPAASPAITAAVSESPAARAASYRAASPSGRSGVRRRELNERGIQGHGNARCGRGESGGSPAILIREPARIAASAAAEVFEQTRRKFVGLFFGHEMAAVGDDGAAHVVGDHLQRLFRLAAAAARFGPRAADGEHRHPQAKATLGEAAVVALSRGMLR
jgi:hypothetical protein